MRTAAQGLLPSAARGLVACCHCLGGVMMEKMFAYHEPVNGLTFNWAGMCIRRRDDCRDCLVVYGFSESGQNHHGD